MTLFSKVWGGMDPLVPPGYTYVHYCIMLQNIELRVRYQNYYRSSELGLNYR